MKTAMRESLGWSTARSMFKAAILLSRIYNMTFHGQCLGWQEVIAENEMSALLSTCEKVVSNNIVGIIGPTTSNAVRVVSPFSLLMNIPMASYSATNPELSDITRNEAFYRVIPSDHFAALAISELFQQFNWSSVSVIIQNDDYGYGGLKVLKEEFYSASIQIINQLEFDKNTDNFTVTDNWAQILSKSSSRIVLVWATRNVTYSILKHALEKNMTSSDFVWILTSDVPMDYFNQSEKERLAGILTVMPVPGALVDVAINSSLLTDAKEICDKINNQSCLINHEINNQSCSKNHEINNYALFAFDATWALILALHEHCNQNSHCLEFEKNVTNCFGVRYKSGTQYRNILRENTTFLGVTGSVQFNKNSTDRVSGAYYLVKNLQRIRKTKKYCYVSVMQWSGTGTWLNHSADSRIVWLNDESKPLPKDYARISGQKLKIVVLESPPFVILKNTSLASNKSDNNSYEGYSIDFIKRLAAQMGFTYEIIVPKSNITYNDVVYCVSNNTYSIAVADLTITAKRTDLVDFSTTFLENALRVVVRRSGTTRMNLFAYFRPLSTYLWLAFFGIIVYSGILIYLFEKSNNKQLEDRNHIKSAGVSLYYSTSSLVGFGSDFATTAAARVLIIGLYIVSVILVATYTANLSTYLALERATPIINGIDDIIAGKIPFERVGILEGGATREYYVNSVSQEYYRLQSKQEIFTKLQSKVIDAAITDNTTIVYETRTNYCDLAAVGRDFVKSAFGIAMSKKWLYKEDLDKNILILRESEVIKLIQQFSGECKQDSTGEPKHSVQSWCDHADITFGAFNIIDADAAAVITAFSRQKSLLAVDKELSQRLKKSDELVQEYVHAKLKLFNQYNLQMTQAEKVMKLLQGLPPDMQAEAHLLQTRQLIQTTDQFVTAVQNLQEAELIRNSVVQGSLPYEQVEPVFC
ncbi:unnamed protein product [Didymodactylos carnosus]|uniref:Uncharacterized protein n=1 Tax=Didymodactylos carnosus TaxID=1234261 RepID=A0A8S2EF68_9BILA|nr:unnamed protein product [Didymodactylos carnosus]CAF3908457.1 unnamed protein product [Didymodactylos carnosus]